MYTIVTWNVRTMNQVKHDVVTAEISRLNWESVNRNGLAWVTSHQRSLSSSSPGNQKHRKNKVAIIINKRISKLVSLKRQNYLYLSPRQANHFYSDPSQCSNHRFRGKKLNNYISMFSTQPTIKNDMLILRDWNAEVENKLALGIIEESNSSSL